MSFGLAMSLNNLAEKLEKEGRKEDAAIILAALREMDMIDARRFQGGLAVEGNVG